MNENQLADIWMLFKEHIDKKQQESVAERYIDLLADYGVSDKTFEAATGVDDILDQAIEYYLDIKDEDQDEDWEDEDNY
jgi:hypothetical protein